LGNHGIEARGYRDDDRANRRHRIREIRRDFIVVLRRELDTREQRRGLLHPPDCRAQLLLAKPLPAHGAPPFAAKYALNAAITSSSGAMIPVILITGHGDIPMAVQAMRDGAFDFLRKPFRDQDLLDPIHGALGLDAENRASVEKHADVKRREESLTPREREVMALVVDGHANKVIAIDLGLSERTVEIHRGNVMEKMGARSVAHLVKMYLLLTGAS
jgi:DNA-binding NarL/FixJ family response regulator